MKQSKYKRVLLKISGEALSRGERFGIDPDVLKEISGQLSEVQKKDVEIALAIGGGNIWRGHTAAAEGMDRSTADYAGMLATMINALALQDALERQGLTVRTQSAISMESVAEPYIRRRAIRHLEKGRVVIFAAGTGNPYMSTDTAAALRAVDIGAEILLLGKNGVDGVYDSDPLVNGEAKKLDRLTYQEALEKRLEVMDWAAFALCMENHLPILVFNLQVPHGIKQAVIGEGTGSLVSD